MDNKKLADLLFPNIEYDLEYYEKKYPKRNLDPNAIVTRFAPSPTGFLHIGSVFTCLIASNFAKKSGGKFLLRIEDTDQTRKIDGAVELIINGLKNYGINFDEGVDGSGQDFGNYGPYTQSERKEIYMAIAKHLVGIGKAYPCFCTEETTERDRKIQEINKELIGYYGSYAHCRNLSYNEIVENIKQKKPFAIRLKCESSVEKRIIVNDAIRGELRLSDNFKDVVILKSDFLPPYNFAHVCDDHFMRVNLVVRGDEYLPSIAEHLQIFSALDFKNIQYAHVAPMQKMDGDSKRKISKRKDPEANVEFYFKEGYPIEAVKEYLLTVANSNFEDWRRRNLGVSNEEFVISLDKMGTSGALFDLPKLNDVSKNIIGVFSAGKVYSSSLNWAEKYDLELFELLKKHNDKFMQIFNIERDTVKPRKDIAKWNEVKNCYSYFFNEFFKPENALFYKFDEKFDRKDIITLLTKYANNFEINLDKQVWFDQIKNLGTEMGYANDMKQYKANPALFKGHYGDISGWIRMAVTGRTNTPDLYEIFKILGREEIVRRLHLCVKLI